MVADFNGGEPESGGTNGHGLISQLETGHVHEYNS